MSVQIENIIEIIKQNKAVVLALAARDECKTRLVRLRSQIKKLEGRQAEIGGEIHEAQDAEARLIASGAPVIKNDEARQRVMDLKAENEVISNAILALKDRAIGKAEKDLNGALERLVRAVTARLDLGKLLLDDEAARLIASYLELRQAWDEAVVNLLEAQRLQHLVDSKKYCLRVTGAAENQFKPPLWVNH